MGRNIKQGRIVTTDVAGPDMSGTGIADADVTLTELRNVRRVINITHVADPPAYEARASNAAATIRNVVNTFFTSLAGVSSTNADLSAQTFRYTVELYE